MELRSVERVKVFERCCVGQEVLVLFYFYRNAANHEIDLISLSGDILVHPSLKVGKAALQGVVAYSATSNLVGNEDKGGFLSSKLIELGLQFLKCLVYIW